jgi:hypothetical protein
VTADVRVGDLALGPGDPLTHRRLGDDEGMGDFGGGQTA